MDQVESHCACTPFGELTNTTNEGNLWICNIQMMYLDPFKGTRDMIY
jgi:hypothetical protein